MKNTLIRLALFLGSAAVGLLVAIIVLPGMTSTVLGFIIAVVVFAVLQAILTPVLSSVMEKYANALTGLVGLITSFLSLLIANAVVGGLRIEGFGTWVLATLLMWILPAIASFLLPKAIARGE